jgi:hypothetical protein
MAKQKQSITLQQQRNPHHISKEGEAEEANPARMNAYKAALDAKGKDWRNPYLYIVVQLKNLLEPPVNETITYSQVNGLIEAGIDVTINPLK